MPGPSTIRQLLSIPFARGLSQHEAPEYLAPGAAVVSQNTVHPKVNRLSKRSGLTALTRAGAFPASTTNASVPVSLATGRRLASFKEQLTVIGADTLTDAAWVYDPVSAQPLLLDRMPETYCEPPEFIASVDPTSESTLARANQMTQAIAGGYEVTVWSVSSDVLSYNGIYYAVRDATTHATVESEQVLIVTAPDATAVDCPKLVVCGNFVILVFASAANIYAMSKNMGSTGAPWANLVRINNTLGDAGLILGSQLTTNFDATTSIGETTKFALAYISDVAGTKAIVLSRIDATAGVMSVAATASGTEATWVADSKPAIHAMALRADSINGELALVMSWDASTTPRVSIGMYAWPAMSLTETAVNLYGTHGNLPATGAVSNCAVQRIGTVGGKTAYKVMFSSDGGLWENGAANIYPYIASYVAQFNSGAMAIATNQPRITWGVTIWSKILALNSIGYVVGYVPSSEQGSFFLFADDAWSDITAVNQSSSASPLRLVGTLSARESLVYSSNILAQAPLFSRTMADFPQNTSTAGGNVYQMVLPRDMGPTACGPSCTRIDFASSHSYQAASLGENTLFAGGCPSAFDGTQVFELGFPVFPIVASTVTHSAGSFAAGTYLYIAIYSWIDARGQSHPSARSVAISVTALLNDSVSLAVGAISYSAKMKAQNGATSGPQANLTQRRSASVVLYRTEASGTTFYQLGPPVAIALDTSTVTIVDAGLSDATLSTHPLLYGDGTNGDPGILDHNCPPSFQCLIAHQNRLFGVDGSNVWPSQAFTTFEGSAFNEAIAFSVDDGPGPLTALASMDSNLILFKRDRIFVMTGLGPNDSGAASDWQPPSRIASDCGCVDWRSVVVTPQGTEFQSDRGKRILSRDLQVSPIATVEGELATFPVPTSAVLHPTQNRALFTQALNVAMTSGEILDHDTLIDSWTTSRIFGAVGLVSGVVANGIGTVSPVYYVLRGNGEVDQESASSFLDSVSTYVPMQFETPWIHAEGIEGFARFRRLMVTWQSADPHQLLVYVAYDMAPFGDAPTYYLIGTVTATMMAAMTTPMCEVAFQLPRQRAQAVRFKIVDAADGTVAAVTGAGPVLVSLGLEVAIYQQKRFGRVGAAQRS